MKFVSKNDREKQGPLSGIAQHMSFAASGAGGVPKTCSSSSVNWMTFNYPSAMNKVLKLLIKWETKSGFRKKSYESCIIML